MEHYRPQTKKILELLSYMVAPADPDGLDMYFATYPGKLKPGNSYQMLAAFDERRATGIPNLRARFANILEDYESKFGKKNYISKIFHPKSMPSIGPRKLSLYILTDGVWQPNTNLVLEIQTLVKHLMEHKLTNKQIGIQFIRFGHDRTGMKRLKRLDSKLGLDL